MRNNHRTADRSTELVTMQRVGGAGEVGLRVEVPITEELERCAVKLACSGPRNDIDDGAGGLTVLGVVVAGLNAEFLQCIREWKWRIDVGHLIEIIAAVQEEVLLAGLRAIGGDGDRGGKCLGAPLIEPIARCNDDARHKGDEGSSIPAVQGKIFNSLFADDL